MKISLMSTMKMAKEKLRIEGMRTASTWNSSPATPESSSPARLIGGSQLPLDADAGVRCALLEMARTAVVSGHLEVLEA